MTVESLFKPLQPDIDYVDATEFEGHLLDRLATLEQQTLQIATNNLALLRQVALLGERLAKLEISAKPRLIGLN